MTIGLSRCGVRLLCTCIAEGFVRAGIEHVVRPAADGLLNEVVAATFSAHLYGALVAGETLDRAVATAHRLALSAPSLAGRSLPEFALLPMSATHAVPLPAPVASGSVRVLRAPPPSLPVAPVFFGGRLVDVHRAVSTLRVERLLTVTGAPGIGKTSVALCAAHYLCVRGVPQDGAVFVRAAGLSSEDALRSAVGRRLAYAPAQSRNCSQPCDSDECCCCWTGVMPLRRLCVSLSRGW